jgi:hypothetical protein
MGNLHDKVYQMWKDAADRKPAKESTQPQQPAISSMPQRRKLDPLLDFIPEQVEKKNLLKKPTPEEIARRIWNNSRNRRKML